VFMADFFSRDSSFFAFLTGFAGRGTPGTLGTSVAFLAASLASRRPFLPLPFPIVNVVGGIKVVRGLEVSLENYFGGNFFARGWDLMRGRLCASPIQMRRDIYLCKRLSSVCRHPKVYSLGCSGP